jgi:hypothetical protein
VLVALSLLKIHLGKPLVAYIVFCCQKKTPLLCACFSTTLMICLVDCKQSLCTFLLHCFLSFQYWWSSLIYLIFVQGWTLLEITFHQWLNLSVANVCSPLCLYKPVYMYLSSNLCMFQELSQWSCVVLFSEDNILS